VLIATANRYLDKPLQGYDNIQTGEYAVLSVSDQGAGISAEDTERIFEPFYTRKVMGRSGTGLGLTIVWNTLQDHKGYIDVHSSSQGTIFHLYFPITRKQPAAQIEADGSLAEYTGSGQKILVVDDEESQRLIAGELLSRLGYSVESVPSGEAALEYLKTHTVDLLVLDMIMDPGINGRQTYEEVLKRHPGQKAIIASGYSENQEVKVAQELGAGQFLKKPYTLEGIGKAVKKELEGT
jgi:CheY-like chemotaxis protein